jgi:diguanylate cyclase (GGDEF)-like protein
VLADRAEVIRQAVSTLVIPHHAHDLPPITASLGVSVVPDATISVTAALAQADAALYAAKRAGRNQVIVHEGAAAAPEQSM